VGARQVGAVVCLSKPLELEKRVAAIESAAGRVDGER
jgi:hypothetical protein